jgi:hypothetical protein
MQNVEWIAQTFSKLLALKEKQDGDWQPSWIWL